MLLSIFTPTYNRSQTIGRLFESLCQQPVNDFEWIIVDDGSTDNTSIIVDEFKKYAKFAIKYYKQTHRGKHSAYNFALEKASGDLLFVVDSDDFLPRNSLEHISSFANDLMQDKTLCGIIAQKEDVNGQILGKRLNHREKVSTFKGYKDIISKGERTFIFKTAIARMYPFPMFDGVTFVTECVVYDKIAKDNAFLTIDCTLTICEYLPNGLSSNIYKLMWENPQGFITYYRQRIDNSENWFEAFRYALRYHSFCDIAHKENRYTGHYSTFVNLLSPIGEIGRWYYKTMCKWR